MKAKNILVIGGAGYAGSVLVPELARAGYGVTVLDTFWYGHQVVDQWKNKECQEAIRIVCGDMRDPRVVKDSLRGIDAVIHLACISNDPSFDLNPELGKEVNLLCFPETVREAKEAGVERFIYASSSSVYGVKDVPKVTEEEPLEPLTDYSRFKASCEAILANEAGGMQWVVVRPATLCGRSPRQRLDLVVNILAAHAAATGKIRVFGGDQLRPNLHVKDCADLYVDLVGQPAEKVAGEVFNAGWSNMKVIEIAEAVRDVVGTADLVVEPSNDPRSYHVESNKLTLATGFTPKRTIPDAIEEIIEDVQAGRLQEPLTNPVYHNIRRMKELGLSA